MNWGEKIKLERTYKQNGKKRKKKRGITRCENKTIVGKTVAKFEKF